MKEVKFYIKRVFGNASAYPESEGAHFFTRLLNQKTLTPSQLNMLKKAEVEMELTGDLKALDDSHG